MGEASLVACLLVSESFEKFLAVFIAKKNVTMIKKLGIMHNPGYSSHPRISYD